MPINRAKHWTAEDDIALIALTGVPGMTQREIAIQLGRSEAAVSARLTTIRKSGCMNTDPQVS
ncbi:MULTISPECIES: sigma factor-like helix-turn-helix DNA-binding protein [Bradyrhizobium]